MERQRPYRVTEVFEHGRLGKRALGTEKTDLQGFLLRQAGRHDLAKETQHLLVAQRTVRIACEDGS